jgi:thymidylate synthase
MSDVYNPSKNHGEQQYLNLLEEILQYGEERDDRTCVGTLSLFCPNPLRFDVENSVPLYTTKFVPWKLAIKELLFFIRGQTDNTLLQEQNVHIWDGNTSKEFMEQYNLPLKENDMGAMYGFMWRHWGADYVDCKTDYTGKGFDQLVYVESELKNNPTSRRIIMNAWNPSYFGKQVLTACHQQVQFYVSHGRYLHCNLYIRSNDLLLGNPINVFSYTVLMYILAKRCNLIPKMLNVLFGDAHIYKNHIEGAIEQLSRVPYKLPQLVVDDSVCSKKWEDITLDDFTVVGYKSHPKISLPMAV